MCTFGLSGCGVKPRRLRGPPGFHTTTRDSKRAHLTAPALQTPRKFHEKNPSQRDTMRAKRWREREEKARNVGPPTLRGHTLRGRTLRGPTFRGRFGQSRPIKVGQSRFGQSRSQPRRVGPRRVGIRRVGAPKGWGPSNPEKMGPRRVAPQAGSGRAVLCRGVGLKGGRPKITVFFSLSRHNFFSFFPLLLVFCVFEAPVR